MLDTYIDIAISRRRCEYLDDDDGYYCNIPDLPGVWATGPTLKACVEELREVVAGWIQLGIELGHPIPVLDGIELTAANVS